MKIGILTSGNDMLALFSFLQRHDHEYIIWYDDAFAFRGDKPVSLVMERVAQGVDFLQKKGVDVVLVPPGIELNLNNNEQFSGIKILPLFQTYIKKHCFAYSLVGKIGFVGDWFDICEGQQKLTNLAKNYVLSESQRSIKKFHFPFVWWSKEVRNWKYFLDTFSWSLPLVNRVVKNDLKCFKDAGVDTIIPMNYAYFHFEKIIKKTFNFKKTRFFGIDVVESEFVSLLSEFNSTNNVYSVSVYHTGHGQFLIKQKKIGWMLSRGNQISVSYVAL